MVKRLRMPMINPMYILAGIALAVGVYVIFAGAQIASKIINGIQETTNSKAVFLGTYKNLTGWELKDDLDIEGDEIVGEANNEQPKDNNQDNSNVNAPVGNFPAGQYLCANGWSQAGGKWSSAHLPGVSSTISIMACGWFSWAHIMKCLAPDKFKNWSIVDFAKASGVTGLKETSNSAVEEIPGLANGIRSVFGGGLYTYQFNKLIDPINKAGKYGKYIESGMRRYDSMMYDENLVVEYLKGKGSSSEFAGGVTKDNIVAIVSTDGKDGGIFTNLGHMICVTHLKEENGKYFIYVRDSVFTGYNTLRGLDSMKGSTRDTFYKYPIPIDNNDGINLRIKGVTLVKRIDGNIKKE